ncbi:MAG TPA: hypothetical protein VMU37_07770, partial [Caulobacteraceae bacterium]|nr:hypothetical protein [Caulobacteraceae bacterium]
MKTLVLVGALLASQPATAPAPAKAPAKAVTDAEAALEGRWAIGTSPGKGACPSGAYEQTQLEFEFQ